MPGDDELRGVEGRSLVVRGAEFASLMGDVLGEQQELKEFAREQHGLPSASRGLCLERGIGECLGYMSRREGTN